MAEEKKSIEISYKANLQDLLSKLKTIPNITDQEAKKMVAALDRQLKQAEKAAQKSAEASKKAAKEAANAAKRGASSFDELADSARRAEDRLERVAESSGDIDRGFSSIGLALRGVNPQLAEAADGLADAFAVTEGLTMSFSALNPIVLAGAAAVGALTLGYMSYQAEVEKSREMTLKLRDAQQALIDTQQEQQNNLIDAGGKLREMRNEYALLTGQITEYEFQLEKAGEAANESFRGNIESAEATIQTTKMQKAAVDSLIAAFSSGETAVLSDQMKEQLMTLQLQNAQIDNNVDLTGKSIRAQGELYELSNLLNAQLTQQTKERDVLIVMQEEAVQLATEMVTLEKELKDANEEAATAAKKVTKAKKETVDTSHEEEDALRRLIELDQERFQKQQDATNELSKLSESTFLTKSEQEELAFEREMQRIKELGETAKNVEMANAIIAEENLKRQKQMKMDIFNTDMANASALSGAFSEFSNAVLQAAMDNGRANQKTIMGLFRMNQAAAVGEIAFNTAKAVTEALAYPPIARAAMIAAAIGTGAAQTSVVMAQKPPQATFHMGGMAPDEMPARVLRGEAVLDRATVRRIGGEEGVKQLSQGTAPQEQVVVVQPFKHFGRFTKEIGFRQPKQTGIRAY
jgi:chromosome segregation ATPase